MYIVYTHLLIPLRAKYVHVAVHLNIDMKVDFCFA